MGLIPQLYMLPATLFISEAFGKSCSSDWNLTEAVETDIQNLIILGSRGPNLVSLDA